MKDTSWLIGTRFAHRGLHDNITVPENSILAFSNAVDRGYGIEFDVYLTRDNRLIVHHDASLKRTCSMNVRATEVNANKLSDYHLLGTDECIPLLSNVLKVVDGKVPLILEIKSTRRVKATSDAIYRMIKSYKGNIAIESFSCRIVNYWLKHYPKYVIGQLYDKSSIKTLHLRATKMYNKVDFLALPVKRLDTKYYRQIKAKNKDKIIIAWTVKTKHDLVDAMKYADNYIFEYNAKDKSYISLYHIDNNIDI